MKLAIGHDGSTCIVGNVTLTYNGNKLRIAVSPLPGNSLSHSVEFTSYTSPAQPPTKLVFRRHENADASDIHEVRRLVALS